MKKFLLALSVLLFLSIVVFNYGAPPADPNGLNSMQLYLQDENDSTYSNILDYKCSSDSSECCYSDKDRSSNSCCSFESSDEK